jgi:periplasmic copper chaperone A
MDDGSATAYRIANARLLGADSMIRSFLAAVVFTFAASAAQAHDYQVGSLKIAHPWARATPKGAAVAGGYLKITNNGKEADRLVSGSVPFAGRFEIHEMSHEGGVMKMRALPKGLEIKPGETVELKPGSFHLMFMELKAPLVKDQTPRPKGTLVFEKAGTVEVEFAIEAIGGAPAEHKH